MAQNGGYCLAYNVSSLVSFPRENGIAPVRRLFSKSKLVKLERFPYSSGIPPVILLPGNDLHD